jgi:hypothetical protein
MSSEPETDPDPFYWGPKLEDKELSTFKFEEYGNAFEARSANGWMDAAAAEPPIALLFGEFWAERELAVLFADTGVGKSIIAVQIAEALARGTPINGFAMPRKPRRVLLFDFELDEPQFWTRYSAPTRAGSKRFVKYDFSKTCIRAKLGRDIAEQDAPKKSYFVDSILSLIGYTQAKTIIIDNVTWLGSSNENTGAVLRLMKQLNALKILQKLSILVLAHTPKRYERSPLDLRDLQGNKMLANFSDSIFAMGTSRLRPDVRYLKHLKSRNRPIRHDTSNVVTLELAKLTSPSQRLKPKPLRAKDLARHSKQH